MANEIEKLNTIEIADIEKVNTLTDDDIEKINTLEFAGVVADWKGSRAIVMGGRYYTAAGSGYSADSIQYKTLTTDGNTSAFDDLSTGKDHAAGSGSNGTRIVYGGGTNNEPLDVSVYTTIDYMVVASTGSVGDAGDLEVGGKNGGTDGASNGVLCFFAKGNYEGALSMEQMNISSTSGATEAGEVRTGATSYHTTTNGDSKFLLMGLGTDQAGKTAIEEHNFSTSADSTAYGNVATVGMGDSGAVCATNRIVVGGGYVSAGPYVLGTRMQFFPVASSADGDSSDSADLVVGVAGPSGTSDGTRGEFYGGEAVSGNGYMQNDIQKVTIASLSNATDIGDLTTEDSTASYYSGMDVGGITNSSAQTGIT